MNKKMKKVTLVLSLLVFLIMYIFLFDNTNKPLTKKNERFYQTKMCNRLKGKIEFVLPDKTRIDCLTDKYAIEVDWARKWTEAVGQSIYYAEIAKKKPAIALIMAKNNTDERHLKRLRVVADKLDIHIIRLDK